MKRFTLLVLTLIMVVSFASLGMADEWGKCAGCHNGKVAPTAETLKGKYKTKDELVKAALASKNAMMKSMQDEEKLESAAVAGGWE